MKKHMFIFTVLFLIFVYGCSEESKEFRISALRGANLYKKPSIVSSVIRVIPFNQIVLVNKIKPENIQISDKYGHWMSVRWKKYNGWIFSPNLENADKIDLPIDIRHLVQVTAKKRMEHEQDGRITIELSKNCTSNANSYKCAKLIEKKQIPQFSNRVQRNKDTLQIKMNDGTWVNLIDKRRKTKPMDVVFFSFRTFLNEFGYYIIHVQTWEGEDYMFLHAGTKKRVIFDDLPSFSPDKKYLFVSSRTTTYSNEIVEIWKVLSGEMRLTWRSKNIGGHVRNPHWINNNLLVFTKLHELYEDALQELHMVKVQVFVSKSDIGSAWRLF